MPYGLTLFQYSTSSYISLVADHL